MTPTAFIQTVIMPGHPNAPETADFALDVSELLTCWFHGITFAVTCRAAGEIERSNVFAARANEFLEAARDLDPAYVRVIEARLQEAHYRVSSQPMLEADRARAARRARRGAH